MSKFGFVGPSYTAKSNTVADEEAINWFAETNETPGAQTRRSYFGTPGLAIFTTFADGPTRGSVEINGRVFVASADTLYEVMADGTNVVRYAGLDVFGGPASIVASNIQLLIVAGGRAFCYTLADNSTVDVTPLLAGAPTKAKYSDGYFIVCFAGSNKFQISDILDGTVWPGIQVNAVSVFPENIVSIEVSHRELWVFGSQHAQPYQDTGTDEVFDVIPGALVETGAAATFGSVLADNTVFWISEDQRGARQAWRANGYTPTRISTHAVEVALASYTADQIANLVTYAYQDGGHLFWVLYIPGTDCTWVYDVAESMWHKRAEWHVDSGTWGPHRSWNHVYAFGKHLVGDWNSGNLYEMSLDLLAEEVAPAGTAVTPYAMTQHNTLPIGNGSTFNATYSSPISMIGSAVAGDDFHDWNPSQTSSALFITFYDAAFASLATTDISTLGIFSDVIAPANTAWFTINVVGGVLGGIYNVSFERGYSVIEAFQYGCQGVSGPYFTMAMDAANEPSTVNIYPLGTISPGDTITVDTLTEPTPNQTLIFYDAAFAALSSTALTLATFTAPAGAAYWTVQLVGASTAGSYDVAYSVNVAAPTPPQSNLICRLRRAPTLNNELKWVYYPGLTVDFATGLGPQPPLQDGGGNPRPPQAMLRWSDNGGSTWSNQHIRDCGFAGEYDTRVQWLRLGRARRRVFELTVSDPIPWCITDAYLIDPQ